MAENLQEIDSKEYNEHLEEVSKICDSSRLTLVQTYWNIENYIAEVIAEGIYLNQQLLDKGLAIKS